MEIILFVDHVGFNIVAEKVSIDKTHVTVKNPAVLQAAPNQQNQLQVQLLPVLFREFLDSSVRENGTTFKYPTDRVVLTDAKLEERLKSQYQQMFGNSTIITPKDTDVVKLFDE